MMQMQLLYSRCDDVIMTMLASQITSLTVVYSIVYSGVNQRKHQSSASLAFVWEIHRGPVNFPHKWPVTRKMFPFDDVIMSCLLYESYYRFPFIISALNPLITVQRVLIAYGNNPMVTLMIGVYPWKSPVHIKSFPQHDLCFSQYLYVLVFDEIVLLVK